jgi:two-component system response regulator GlrR
MNSADILLVDDDPDLRQLIGMRLTAAGHRVQEAGSGEEALGMLSAARPDVLVTDLRMAGLDGLALFDRARALAPSLPVIILTAHGTIPDAVEATQRGVFGFLTKPFDSRDLLNRIDAALQVSGGGRGGMGERAWCPEIITRSHLMEELLSRARRVAAGDASVLLEGASGTGKELLARAIHRASPRAASAFVAVNCAAIPETLLESELFGHVKGAFSGASQNHKGLFQAADGGTLFLDEIGDMPVSLQAKLLRALEERAVRPVGAVETVPADVRLISATHRNLRQLVHDGGFREDLYYRMNVVTLQLPPLAERQEDIALLAEGFLARLTERYGKPAGSFAPNALQVLVEAPWPGNVRQLLNVVEHSVALSVGDVIPAALVCQALHDDEAGTAQPLDEARRQFEHDYLLRLLKTTAGNVAQAARMAGRNRTEFYSLLKRHHLDPALFKEGSESP